MSEERKTRLERELNELPQDAGLKVGAKTGFFYCGTVVDFTEHMDEYSFLAMKRAETAEKRAIRRLEAAIAVDASPSAYVRSMRGDAKIRPLTPRGYTEFLEGFFKTIDLMTEKANKARNARENFHPLRERDVIRVDKSNVEENTFIIVISGEEIGQYWLLSEAKDSKLSFGADGDDDA